MKHIFREYDIRGIFGQDLVEDVVKKIGYFLGKKIDSDYVFVSYDARTHSPTLHNWLVSGLNKAGKKILSGGILPTGTNYFANFVPLCLDKVGRVEIGGSIQITGSHNPKEYNGFKITINKKPFYGKNIYELGEEVLKSDINIEDNFDVIKYDLKSQYVDFLANQFSHLQKMDLNAVFDCGNGAAGVVLRNILEKLKMKNYEILYENPDGNFPNHHPDPTEEENLKDVYEKLKEKKYAFAYDGDADRIAFLDRKYNYKGDILAYFFAKNLKEPCIISEVKATQVLYDEVNKFGKAIMYKTGHSNLKTLLYEKGCDLAAEVSGHIFFNDRYFGIDDAIYATFRILELIDKGFDFVKEYESLPKVYNTDEIKVKTTEDKKFKIIDGLKKYLQENKEKLGIKDIIDVDGVRVNFENGWGLVRASNTTPVLVTRFEAKSKEDLEKIQSILVNILQKFL
ncbi:phosphomannomutase/phosphoglucomutase [Caminibacter mediatlanticus]|uniref:Phosphomannomutase n=1 Tax=Caminibacter mediatlanticus TB-2 TaxID=391592 RepID=A0AAI9AG57_9BACT|nr:phosphomannomutase/phosphoglucomutase [Caminibacter mediatlanticus]EDM23063.1 Phosphomannomutase [Caminibacter mediatlanticus TB-2]